MKHFSPSDFETLRSIPALRKAPDSQLRWLLDKSELRTLQQSENLFEPDMLLEHLYILLEGSMEVFLTETENREIFFRFKKGAIFGYLPYSDVHKSPGYGQATTPIRLCAYPKKDMPELIRHNHELTEALVQVLIFKARNLTTQTLQNEKMLALGKLTAGLSHELNNPISSIQRDAAALKRLFDSDDLLDLILTELGLAAAELAALRKSIGSWTQLTRPAGMNPSDIVVIEKEWLDKLTQWGMKNPDEASEVFTDSGIPTEEVDRWVKKIHPGKVDWWLCGIQFFLQNQALVTNIQQATGRVKNLTKAVKTFTHMGRDAIRTDLDLAQGIEDTLIILSHKIKATQVEITLSKPEKPVPMTGFPSELNQVWTNLLDNALDAIGNTPAPKLQISIISEKNSVAVLITDNGPGIPDHIKSRIFDPFFTTKKIGIGSGMGLELVQQIISKHHGKIQVDSIPGQTTFRLDFPKD